MFGPPPEAEAQIFAVVPETLRHSRTRYAWGAGAAERPTFLEGPAFDREGALWVTDIPCGRLFRIAPSGEMSLGGDYAGQPNGLKFHKDGRGFIADRENGLMVFDPRTGSVETYLDRSRIAGFKGLNDLVFASNGDLYFTDQGLSGLEDPTGRLMRLRADGRLERLLDNVPGPNGLVLNKAETTLFLAVTRANAIWKISLLHDGGVSRVGTYIQMSGGDGPDGLAIDDDDNLAVCHVGMGSVWLFFARGEPVLRIRSPVGPMTTNCAYGGPENRTLYITESHSGSVLTARMPVPGRTMYSHQP